MAGGDGRTADRQAGSKANHWMSLAVDSSRVKARRVGSRHVDQTYSLRRVFVSCVSCRAALARSCLVSRGLACPRRVRMSCAGVTPSASVEPRTPTMTTGALAPGATTPWLLGSSQIKDPARTRRREARPSEVAGVVTGWLHGALATPRYRSAGGGSCWWWC